MSKYETIEKCELTSEIVDYIWYKQLRKDEDHSYFDKDTDEEKYIDQAQDIFNDVYDIVDEALS